MIGIASHARPFLVSYGGGHAQIIIAIASELDRRGRAYSLLGLTTAHQAFVRAGLCPMPIGDLIDPMTPDWVRTRARELAPRSDHPDITDHQTIDYFTIGYADLLGRFGRDEAESRITEHGRKAFEPVSAFRHFYDRSRPSIVVSTTSPRFEAAALRAARGAGIPSLAIGDMYLIAEQEWILSPDYARDLTVISNGVAEMLQSNGDCSSRIHVLGNPAFDTLAPSPDDPATRLMVRERLCIGDRKCILWPLGGAPDEVAGRQLLEPAEVAAFLDVVCDRTDGLTYVLRPHPNWPVHDLVTRHGQVDADSNLDHALLAADLVCVEASTVGLQAVLRGIPTICYNFADYVLYPDFGWAARADTLDEMARQITTGEYFTPPADLSSHVGGASGRVVDLIERLEREEPSAH
ncbi:hypothetical protein ACWPM1_01805 [Tsuneonella sp. HG249]